MARTLFISLTVTCAAALIAAAPASAVTCDQLQGALDGSAPGSTVTLDEGEVCLERSFELPQHQITLQGGGSGATFDGNGELRPLSGHNVQDTVIRNLNFQNGNANGDGGAIRVSGNSPIQIVDSVFESNEADANGGAVAFGLFLGQQNGDAAQGVLELPAPSITDSLFLDNQAFNGIGGAVFAAGTGDLALAGNTFLGNVARGLGGGVAAFFCGTATVEDNVFQENELRGGVLSLSATQGKSPDFGDVAGGGLFLDGTLCQLGGGEGPLLSEPPAAEVAQRGNLFEGNVLSTTEAQADGAGEALVGTTLTSRDDVFHANRAEGDFVDGAGGALDIELFRGDQAATAHNLVATANQLPDGEGGAINLAGAQGGSTLTLVHATIAGNEITGEGEGSAIDGGDFDSLVLRNSIVHGNTGAAEEISGFVMRDVEGSTQGDAGGQRDIRFTLACDDDAPLPGEGNLCADPELAGVADGDVHQTAASPSIDAASGALEAGIEEDFEGDARSLDGDDDGEAVPDMGADEAPGPEPEPEPEPEPQPGQPQPPAPPAPAAGVQGEQARSCVSRRRFRIRLRNRRQKVRSATVLVNGKRVRVLRGKRLTSVVDLRGLPKGRFTVKIVLRLANGTKLEGVRRYRTCAKPRPGGIPRV